MAISEDIAHIHDDIRASVMAAAYMLYIETKPDNQLTHREFQRRFIDNWEVFANLDLPDAEGAKQ